jgi:regulatory protein YycH of two-component signal transduction system YycFG
MRPKSLESIWLAVLVVIVSIVLVWARRRFARGSSA